MGNQTSRRPIELGAYVTNAKAEVSQRQEEVHRLHRSLWDLSQQRQVNDAKVEDRRQRLKRALARNVGVCVDDAGLRSWCEVKLSRALLRPGAVLEYLRAVQQHLDGPVQRKRCTTQSCRKPSGTTCRCFTTSWRPCYSRRNRLFWTWTRPTRRRAPPFGPTKAPPFVTVCPPTRFPGRS